MGCRGREGGPQGTTRGLARGQHKGHKRLANGERIAHYRMERGERTGGLLRENVDVAATLALLSFIFDPRLCASLRVFVIVFALGCVEISKALSRKCTQHPPPPDRAISWKVPSKKERSL